MKIFRVLWVVVILSGMAFTGHAQANQTLNLPLSNGNLFRYGYQGILVTTDSGAHTIATFPIATDEAGILETQVVGIDTAGGNAVTGSLIVRYKKKDGTLTLASPTNVSAIVTDAGLSGATFAFAASSNNVLIRVTGDTATTVRWIANTRWIKKP